MKGKRGKGTLLLLLLINLTACQTWQSVSLGTLTPAEFVEEDRPDRVRVTGPDVLGQEVAMPTVTGDQLVGLQGFSMPLEDIYEIEVRKLNLMGTVLLTVAAIPVLFWVGMGLCGLQGKALGEC
tara:strand:+ start:20 stop:391 length:372 start_codon:yes stop_codon:yes gene_type:complete